MLFHLDSVLRVTLILGASLAVMPLLSGRPASARRLVLVIAFVAAAAVPLLPSRVAALHVDAPAAYQELAARMIDEPAVASSTTPAPAATASSPVPYALLWLVGALAVGARFALGFLVAAYRARTAARARSWDRLVDERVDVRVSAAVRAPAVAGLVRPVVLVPVESASWSDDRKRSVLLHELAHARAQDVRVQLVAAIVCSLHWFNPLAWLAAWRLRLERELAADEAVLRAGVRASSYAEDLLAIAAAAPLGMVALGEKPLVRRIEAIVGARRPRRLGRAAQLGLAAGAASTALAVACTDVTEAPKRPVADPAPAATTPPLTAMAPARSESSLQRAVTSELEGSVEVWRADGGAILVLTPKGEVLAEAGDPDRTIVAGSTMKPLLLAAAFEADAVQEADVGDLLATSSNPGFTRIFEQVGREEVRRVLQGFHFATPATLDAPAAIGATMTATPRQVARAYASLANGGDGVVSERTATRVTRMMEGVVVSEKGTGKKARVEGTRVAGKTGSSDWTANDAKHTYASFVGFVPADRPRFVIYVGIESPKGDHPWGGEVAAPVFARLASQLR